MKKCSRFGKKVYSLERTRRAFTFDINDSELKFRAENVGVAECHPKIHVFSLRHEGAPLFLSSILYLFLWDTLIRGDVLSMIRLPFRYVSNTLRAQ